MHPSLLILAWASPEARAYPFMVHHGYNNCAQCHVDPSGAGILTDYGRAQGEILLRSNYGHPPESEAVEKSSAFLFGAVELPKPLELQVDIRSLVVPDPAAFRWILMQGDARAAIQTGMFLASGALGVVGSVPGGDNAPNAWITSSESGWNLVSREYWLGLQPVKGLTVRAGRMNLPFGIRTEDHILFVRKVTGTDINDDQQVGLSLTYNTKKVRTELMGIAGNFQMGPDEFRKRGYSGYFAFSPSKTFELGLSSLLTNSSLDAETLAPRLFLAEGFFTRAAPVPMLAVMAEADVLLDFGETDKATGLAATAILDLEPYQGLHLQGIGQYCDTDFGSKESPAWNGGGAVDWYFATRMSLRVDAAYGVYACTQGADKGPYGLAQLHFYL